MQKILDLCLKEAENLDIEFLWIKGHNNNKWNEFADKLANDSILFLKTNLKLPQSQQTILELNCSYLEKYEVKKMGASWNKFSGLSQIHQIIEKFLQNG